MRDSEAARKTGLPLSCREWLPGGRTHTRSIFNVIIQKPVSRFSLSFFVALKNVNESVLPITIFSGLLSVVGTKELSHAPTNNSPRRDTALSLLTSAPTMILRVM